MSRQSETRRIRRKRKRVRNMALVNKHKAKHPCVCCGETDPVLLTFDHKFPHLYTINQIVVSYGPKRLIQEMNKCNVMCRRCHCKKHGLNFNIEQYLRMKEQQKTTAM